MKDVLNRMEFISILTKELQNINAGELQEVITYYNEYFDEAAELGEENLAQAIKELGSPEKIASEIIQNANSELNTNIDLDKFNSICINVLSEQVNFIHSNENRVECYINNDAIVEKCGVTNGKFEFSCVANKFNKNKNFEVEGYINLYYNLNTELQEINIVTLDSDIILRNTKVDTLICETISGDISINNEFNSGRFNTVSGDIEVNSNFISGFLNTASGDIEVNSNFTSSFFNTASGDIEINSNFTSGNFNTASGDIGVNSDFTSGSFNTDSGDIEIKNLSTDINKTSVNTVSGDINLTLVKDMLVKFSTISGDGYKNGESINLNCIDEDSACISVNTVSGDFNLYC